MLSFFPTDCRIGCLVYVCRGGGILSNSQLERTLDFFLEILNAIFVFD